MRPWREMLPGAGVACDAVFPVRVGSALRCQQASAASCRPPPPRSRRLPHLPAAGTAHRARRTATISDREALAPPFAPRAPLRGRARPRRAGLAGRRLRARPDPARQPADPRVAVRLGRGDRPDRVVRRAGGAVAEPAPGGHRALAGAARFAGHVARVPRGRDRRGRRRCLPAGADDRVRPVRGPGGTGELRPHLRLHHLLGRDGVRQRAVRRRLPGPEPVARDRPRAVPRGPRTSPIPTGSAAGPPPPACSRSPGSSSPPRAGRSSPTCSPC